MGHGGQGIITTSTYSSRYSASALVGHNSIGEFVAASRQGMASGHSRSSSCDSSTASSSSAGYIEHPVSRLDTLAGVAIKYGVEVGDIKRMNGLVTDLQMFALKTLKIPLPGRHLPTSSHSNAGFSGKPTRLGNHSNLDMAQILRDSGTKNEPEKRPVTSAMGLLRGYYGLSSGAREGAEGTEMAVYKSDTDYHSEDEPASPFQPFSPFSPPEMADFRHRSDRSYDSGGQFLNAYDSQVERHPGAGKGKAAASFEPFPRPSRGTVLKLEAAGESGGLGEIERANDRLFRRRAKGEYTGPVPDIPAEISAAPEVEGNDRISNVPLGKSSVLRQKIPPPLEPDSDTLPRPVVNSSLNGWHTSIDSSSGLAGSAVRAFSTSILSGKAVEGLISKIRRSASNSTIQEERRSYKADSSGTLLAFMSPTVPGGNSERRKREL
ncbi:unnamed protein product [Calypogeia fissa]